jgi:predicted transcriptional regulator
MRPAAPEITPNQLRTLMAIATYDGQESYRRIAEQLGKKYQSVWSFCLYLREAGMLTAEIKLTKTGRAYLAAEKKRETS